MRGSGNKFDKFVTMEDNVSMSDYEDDDNEDDDEDYYYYQVLLLKYYNEKYIDIIFTTVLVHIIM